MAGWKMAAALVAAVSVFFSGCSFRLGFKDKYVGATEKKTPLKSRVESTVRTSPPSIAVLTFNKVVEEEIRTVENYRRMVRELDFTWWIVGAVGASVLLLVIGLIAGASGDSSGGSSHDWDDWD